jgi:hypothetical protein
MIIHKLEDERIDWRPASQFFGWGYVIFTVLSVGALYLLVR